MDPASASVHRFDVAEVVGTSTWASQHDHGEGHLLDSDHRAENEIVERGEIEDTDGAGPSPGSIALLAVLPLDSGPSVTSCSRALAGGSTACRGMFILRADDHFVGHPARQARSRTISERRGTAGLWRQSTA